MSETDGPVKKGEDGRGRAWPLFVGLPLILAVAVAAVIFSGGGERPGLAEQERPPQPVQEERPSDEARLRPPALGSADVPVVMVEYGDFQCPFCGKFAREVEPKLVERYVEDGTLSMEWRDFPYLGQESLAAASGGALRGALLLAVYAAGMALPLFLLALFWDRLGRCCWLRGREVTLGRLRLHTTNLIAGAMFVLLGVLFIAYEGTSALSGLYESSGATDLAFAAEQWANSVARRVPGVVILAALAALLAVLLLRGQRRGSKGASAAGDEPYAARRGESA